jgi:DNA-binding GntR family transcriptional regulator
MSDTALDLPRIEHRTLNEQAYRRMKHALLSGRIEPGATLTLRHLAEQLGTSMMPVREAITRLSAEDAVQVLPQRGIVVPPLSDDDARDLWDLRIRLEGEACARAARHVTRAALAHIGELCAAVHAAAERDDLYAVLECNSDFQFAIYQAACSTTLLQLIEILRMKSVPHCTAAMRVLLAERPPYYAASWVNHDALVGALERGDAAAARRIKQRDLREFRDFVNSVGSEPA